jgi:hypothetical protein
MDKLSMTANDILSQVKIDYDRSILYVENKRADFENHLKLYNNQKKKKEKIGDTTVYSVHSALLARLYISEVTTTFEWDVGIEHIASNVSAMYKEDYECEEYAMIKYQRYWDSLFYWVGITAKIGWDWRYKRAKFQNIDPRNWLPDPDGDYASWQYSFTAFEKLFTKTELKDMGIYNKDLIPVDYSWTWYRGAEKNKQNDKARAWLSTHTGKTSTHNEQYAVVMYFGTFNGERACVITSNNNTLLLWVRKLKPIYEYEKKNTSRIDFPFDFTYYRPERWNPFGRSVVDDTADVQRAKAIIANLRLDKSFAELHPMYMYNTRLVKNKSDLDFGFNKMIAVNPLEWESMDNAIKPIRFDFRADNSYLIEDRLDEQVSRATSIGNMQQGSDPKRRETATTNKLQQSNSDININLTARLFAQWDKKMAELWLRALIEKFSDWDTKKVTIYNGITYMPLEIRKEDIVWADKLKIVVKSEAEISERRQKEINAFNMAFPILQASNIPQSSLNYVTRDFLRNLGYEESKTWVAVPQTPQEIEIHQDIELLNMWEIVHPSPEIDVQAALILINNAKPWLNRELYKMELMEMYKLQGRPQEQMQDKEALQQNAVAQAGAWLQNMAQQFTW